MNDNDFFLDGTRLTLEVGAALGTLTIQAHKQWGEEIGCEADALITTLIEVDPDWPEIGEDARLNLSHWTGRSVSLDEARIIVSELEKRGLTTEVRPNAVTELRARTGAANDSALARMLGVSPATVSRWRAADRVPEHTTQLPSRGTDMTVADLRKAIALLPDADRRALTLDLMTDMLGG